jgi:dihydrodipicolinate synthase/N-acetylneuraminate lyase
VTGQRYKRTILATCCVPWSGRGEEFDEDLFRSSVHRLMSDGFRDLYIFGTAGEGHNVSDRGFKRVAEVFITQVLGEGEVPMVGVISTSLPTMLDRIECAAGLGCRVFQFSFANWGRLNDKELAALFRAVCGAYPQLQFIHYNIARSGRVVLPHEYARLAEEHPNLVGTKYGAGEPEIVNGLLLRAGSLRHFFTELGFFYGSVVGECGFLASIASTNPFAARQYYEAGTRGDLATLAAFYRELAGMMAALREAVGAGPHLDAAFDKILSKINDARFPLYLQPPYEGSTEGAYLTYREVLATRYPRWLSAEALPSAAS